MEFVHYAAWSELPPQASSLFKQTEKESIFFSEPWFENMVSHGLKEGENLLLAGVKEGDHLLALLPLGQSELGYCRALKHLYTSLYTLLLAEPDREEVIRCLALGLKQLPIYALQLEPIAEDDAGLHRFEQVMVSEGYTSYRKFCFYNWIHRLNGESYADYMAGRPSRVRNTIRRKKRKLEQEQGYRIALFSEDDFETGLADYHVAYNASWKANEVFRDFVQGLVTHFSQAGWLRLAILYIKDQPVAGQIWFVAHGKASIYKLAYDERWKQYSPGSILIAYLMQHVIEVDHIEEIDFLTGNDAYKQDWMSERRERFRLSLVRPAPPEKGSYRYFFRVLHQALKWFRLKV